ncbi:hypothetical protein E3N88_07227 [Mikania micrantha]|uniref:Uncharacterized protein n=1 Tax=Mikania micrantha TaxID=192012 RepID=A0A5N6PRM7_9ASTR|nr:hypothetical protein E3N88_07227 [Mikania micrantha]
MTLSHAFMAEVDDKRNEVIENLCSISCIEKVFKYRSHNEALIKEELLSDKESNYRDAKCRIEEITLELDQVKTWLSKPKIRAEKYDYSDNLVASMLRSGEGSQRGLVIHEFTTGSNKPVSLTVDPILSDLKHSDDSKVYVEGLSVSGQSEKKEERSAGRSTYCLVSSNNSQFSVPKVDFVGKFETICIKPNEMIKKFWTQFVKTDMDV